MLAERTKKILFIIGFIAASVVISAGLYYFFFKPLTGPTPISPSEQLPTATLPTAGAGQPGQGTTTPPGSLTPSGAVTPGGTGAPTGPADVLLLRDGVTRNLAAATTGDGGRFYNPDDGRYYRVDADGNIIVLSDKQFFNVDNTTWSPKANNAILEFPDGSNVLYDFDAKRQVTLPKHWEGFAFSPDGSQIEGKSISLDASNRFMFVSASDGNEAHAVAALGDNADKVIPSWSPNQQVLAFSKTGTAQADGSQEIYLVGSNGENFKSLIVPGRGFQPSWSPSGDHILYSVYHERDALKPSLWVSGGSGDNIGEGRRSLNLQTWADKCAWRSEAELICAVPQQLDDGAGLLEERSRSVPDNIFRVDLTTGVSTQINSADQTHPVLHPVVSSDGKKLIFTDGATGQLFEYALP